MLTNMLVRLHTAGLLKFTKPWENTTGRPIPCSPRIISSD